MRESISFQEQCRHLGFEIKEEEKVYQETESHLYNYVLYRGLKNSL